MGEGAVGDGRDALVINKDVEVGGTPLAVMMDAWQV
jgi:hypothetical protein